MDRLVYALGFVVIVACGAIVMATGQALPPVVASHFAANGVAGSFMPRDDYVHFMAALTTLVNLPVGRGSSFGKSAGSSVSTPS